MSILILYSFLNCVLCLFIVEMWEILSAFNFLCTEVQSLVVPLAKVFWVVVSFFIWKCLPSHLLFLCSGDSLLPLGCKSIPAGRFHVCFCWPWRFQVSHFRISSFRGLNQTPHSCTMQPRIDLSHRIPFFSQSQKKWLAFLGKGLKTFMRGPQPYEEVSVLGPFILWLQATSPVHSGH